MQGTGGKHQKKKKVESQSVLTSEFSVAEKADRLTEWDSSYSTVITLLLDLKRDTKWEIPSWCNPAEKLCLNRDFFSLPKKPLTPLRHIWPRETN